MVSQVALNRAVRKYTSLYGYSHLSEDIVQTTNVLLLENPTLTLNQAVCRAYRVEARTLGNAVVKRFTERFIGKDPNVIDNRIEPFSPDRSEIIGAIQSSSYSDPTKRKLIRYVNGN